MNTKNEKTVDDRLKHIAFIMDGNGRWAKKRGMPRSFGHKHGAKAFRNVVEYCGKIGIKHVTVYAFSTENWGRPQGEIDSIIELLDKYIDECAQNMEKYDVRLRFIGDMTPFDDKLKAKIKSIEEMTKDKSLILDVALNYGGRAEIVNACNRLIKEGKTNITEDDISRTLYTAGAPDPDLIVRTAGEMRLSNFLMWQSAYSEFYFTDTLWPDMGPADVDLAVEEFYKRKRRFGKVL
ncbi:MAG: di-trans,poly-cis-decaprenylcistransferase [Clostridia bacterium]|nr:di-trans,poly-cis-decaprenylcistransferase [Clostridia bacterium]